MPSPPLLCLQNLSKRFGRVIALNSVTLTLEKGRVYGLAGENGAGKSTLVKILGGVYRPDRGGMEMDGCPFHPRDSAEAEKLGVSVFHQEIPVCPNLSITANVFLGPRLPRRGLFPDWRGMEKRCEELFIDLLGTRIDPRQRMGDCTVAERQLALLARVLSRNGRLIILDEPTTALSPAEVSKLFAVIHRLQSNGITFLFVSHRLDELMELADEIYVVRDGNNVGQMRRNQFDVQQLASWIAGQALATIVPTRKATRSTAPRLEVRGLTYSPEFKDVSFRLFPGEILAITGLQGSGRSAVARALFAAPAAERGEILLNGTRQTLKRPADAIRAGIGYVPEDRKTLGLFDDLDVQRNLGLLRLKSLSRFGWLSRHALRDLALAMQQQLQIKMAGIDGPITSLSGGNQQKVLIARWLAIAPQVLIMNEPTRGVDIGAKEEICRLLRRLADDGGSFVVASSDLDEVLRLADRILVMRRGTVAVEFSREAADKQTLIEASSFARAECLTT